MLSPGASGFVTIHGYVSGSVTGPAVLIGELRSEQPPALNMRMMAANIDLFITNARARDWSVLIKWDHGPTSGRPAPPRLPSRRPVISPMRLAVSLRRGDISFRLRSGTTAPRPGLRGSSACSGRAGSRFPSPPRPRLAIRRARPHGPPRSGADYHPVPGPARPDD